jgi:DNA (cytosine-5)-methyltransferase 1
MIKKPLTYISLFSSAGVGCYGFKMTDFECIATNEILEKRLYIQKCNKKCRYDSGYILGDITNEQTKDLLRAELNKWENKFSIKELDVLIATPPCQGMSVANHKKKDEKNRNSLVVESILLTKEINPKFFIFENVRAFINTICTDSDGIDKSIGEAIDNNLSGTYNILTKVINFKEYGSNSSRTRTLVIGVRKDILDVTPYNCFPTKESPKTLRELIGNLPSLKEMEEISDNDIYHSYRKYDKRMVPWIEKLIEGQSAFDNEDINRIPHKIVNGKIVLNQNKNGDKYSRWYWDREGPCIHTRNDILSSQSTIHPEDNRVFSIRELMKMMSIPDSYAWTNKSFATLNKMSLEEKKHFLKKEDLNIRQCIGESVPTEIFRKIALNIKTILSRKKNSLSSLNLIIDNNNLRDVKTLKSFIEKNKENYLVEELFAIAEFSNLKRLKNAAFYTRQDICFSVIKNLPSFKGQKNVYILEPSVGIGNFLPLLFKKYEEIPNVKLDVIDLDDNSISVLKILLKKINIPINFKIRFINSDFLLWKNDRTYDLVVGNPPYNKITKDKELLEAYRSEAYNIETNNIFSFFIEKSIRISKHVSLIVPKSLINAPEFNKTRDLLNSNDLLNITDYGEKAFKGVKIETISFLLKTNTKVQSKTIKIESYIKLEVKIQLKNYIFDNFYPYWIIYRDQLFDEISSMLNFNVFTSFRDRQITKSNTSSVGKIRVLKSRNVKNNEIIDIENYDTYIDHYEQFSVSKYINNPYTVLIPNLTYLPRATFLPLNCIADGSLALLTLKNSEIKLTVDDLAFYSTKKFQQFYRVARNFGTRSLNIDNNSVFFFGLQKEKKIK